MSAPVTVTVTRVPEGLRKAACTACDFIASGVTLAAADAALHDHVVRAHERPRAEGGA